MEIIQRKSQIYKNFEDIPQYGGKEDAIPFIVPEYETVK